MKHTIEYNGIRKTVSAPRTATLSEVADLAFGFLPAGEYGNVIVHGSGTRADAPPVATERPADWMYHDMTCAHRRIGPGRGPCDCGYDE